MFIIAGHLYCRWCLVSTGIVVHLMLLLRKRKNRTIHANTKTTITVLFLVHSANQFNEVIDKNIMMHVFVKLE